MYSKYASVSYSSSAYSSYPGDYTGHLVSRSVSAAKGAGVEELLHYSKHELHVKQSFQSVYRSNYWSY